METDDGTSWREMMSIDWSKAPEGATHFDTKLGWFCSEFEFWDSDLKPHSLSMRVDWGTDRYIPRPTKPAAPEWDGEGLPPVGEDLEASFVSGYMDQYWSKGKVVAHDNGLPVVCVGGVYYALNLDRLRPLRTKEQRERDELKSLLEDNIRGLYCYEDGKVRADVEEQVDAILSRYNLEPKP